jgi:choline dehydrogenase-like flavoprotein
MATSETLRCRAVVVGSGVAACLTAQGLLPGGDVLVLERGADVSHADRLQSGRHEKDGPTSVHQEVALGPWSEKRFQTLHVLGGTTNHWTGRTPRLMPVDFRMRSAYGVMDDWPIGYEELEPYYCRAEDELGVAGQDDNPRTPRSRGYALPAHPLSPADRLVESCLAPGAVITLPQARPTRALGTRPACCGSGTCGLCPVDSKYTALNTHLPRLRADARVRLLTEAVVVSLDAEGGRRVRSAQVRRADGSELRVEAELFVLAAGALENAAILLRSPRLPQHPLTGRYLADHADLVVTARIDQDGFPNHGTSQTTSLVYEFYDGPFRATRAGALGSVKNRPDLDAARFVVEAALDRGLRGEALRADASREFRRQVGITFQLEDLPDPENRVLLGAATGALGLPGTAFHFKRPSPYVEKGRAAILEALPRLLAPLGVRGLEPAELLDRAGHVLGTCRMGDSRTGVVDRDLRYHEADNLFVVGASAFPTSSPANPTLTLAALALRLGDHLRG